MNRRFIVIGIVVLIVIGLSSVFWLPPLISSLAKAESTATPAPTSTPTPTPTPPAFVEVQVVVRDAETQAPVADARVRIGENEGLTDGDGACTVWIKNEASYTAYVQSARYLEGQQALTVALRKETPFVVEMELEPNKVMGQVLGHKDRPLVDATLTIGDQQAALDAQARFVLTRVANGDVLTASRPGYQTYSGSYDGSTSIWRLEPITTTVRVYDSLTGFAVSEASVCLDDAVCDEADASGTIVVHGLADDAAATVRREGYFTATFDYDGQAAYSVELVPRQLVGFVRDVETGEPLTDTLVLFNGDMASVDRVGRYHLPELTGVYTLLVKTPGYERVTIPVGPGVKAADNEHLKACRDPSGLSCVEISLTHFAVKGIYVNFNLLMWNKERVLELIDMVDRSPILNAIVVDIKSDRGFIAFESDDPIVASVSNAMSTPRLPLPEFLSLCKEKGIYTIARMVIFKDNELIVARPELAVRHPDGEIFYDREGMAWGDPTREEVWEYNIAISKEAIRMGFDEIQYDYLRYPSDSTSLEVVRALIYSIPYSLESRVAAVSGFVAAAKAAIDPTPAFLSADIFGFALSVTPEHDMRIGQRLMDIAPLVDYVCPMVYPSTFIPGNLGLASPSDQPYEVVEISMAYGMARTDTIIRPWLQHYWYERYEIAEQRRAAEAANDEGWCYWNAGAAYDEAFFLSVENDSP
ncbi:MAG: hypothetical protein JXA89_05755 [Anaerolineae bacterium]|nr:hypothetical protein [Anaerolineae bacterium]